MYRPNTRPSRWLHATLLFLVVQMFTHTASAELRLPSIFSSHMVLQQGQQNRVWGWSDAGAEVTVQIGQQTHQATADDRGRWQLKLDALPAGGPHVLTVKAGDDTVKLQDVLVGEVWVCSGQSNMQWPVQAALDPDLEIPAADYPQIRLITVPQVGTQEPQEDFDGQWQICSPQTVANFSAVGYYFGRQLHRTLNVPIGLIDNAWGGSAAEAWVRRDLFEQDEQYAPLLARWKETEQTYDAEKEQAAYEQRLQVWKQRAADARKAGKQPPARPRAIRNPLTGQHRPANLYNGVLKPIIGYGIRGVIWYQGESNAERAYQYRHLFPLMIQNWRDDWQQDDFPFYWVQLADFKEEKPQPEGSSWAELREAQTMTLDKLPNTGQAVITDLGEASDIHPRNKQDVAKRLARIALARDYGRDLVYRSPRFESMERQGDKLLVTFDTGKSQLDTFDVRQPIGFAVAGEDQKFVWAKAEIVGPNQVQVWSDEVSDPVAVRYAWADNPVANLQNREGLPATPFRSDDWPGVTAENRQ